MSAKASKRSSRKSVESDKSDGKFKIPETEPTKNGSHCEPEDDLKGFSEAEVKEATENTVEDGKIVTRSRSSTPQIKKPECEDSSQSQEEVVKEDIKEDVKENVKEDVNEEVKEAKVNGSCENGVGPEMEPLVLEPDEPEPELQFDENSDLESGKNSPIISRCVTRRSQLRNIPTPKTPKSFAETPEDADKIPSPNFEDPDETKTPELIDTTKDSVTDDNLSTRVEVGGDSTRVDFTFYGNAEINSPFLEQAKERTFGESLRLLSSRRSVRSVDRTLPHRSDLNIPYPERESVESLPGMKRKNRSETPEDGKRFKRENSSGILSYITSPVFSFRGKFAGDVASSTPKLTGFKRQGFDDTGVRNRSVGTAGAEKKWCSIM